MRLARPAGGKLGAAQHMQARVGSQFAQDLRGAIRGPVVQDDDLQVGIGLCQERPHAAADVGGLVPGRDAHRYQRRIGRRRGRFDDDIHVILVVDPVNDKHASEEGEGGEQEVGHGVMQGGVERKSKT